MSNKYISEARYYNLGEGFHNTKISSFKINDETSNYLLSGISNTNPNTFHFLNLNQNNELTCNKIIKTNNKIIDSKILKSDNIINLVSILESEKKQIICCEKINYDKFYEENKTEEYLREHNIRTINHTYFKFDIDDNKLLLTGNNKINIYDLENKIESELYKTDKRITSLCNIKENNLYGISENNNIIILDPNSKNNKIIEIKNCHLNDIKGFTYNVNRPDILLTWSFEFGIKLWDIRKPNGFIKMIENEKNIINSACFNNYYDQLILYSTIEGGLTLYNLYSESSTKFLNIDDEEFNSNAKEDKELFHEECLMDDLISDITFSNSHGWDYGASCYNGKAVFETIPSKLKLDILL